MSFILTNVNEPNDVISIDTIQRLHRRSLNDVLITKPHSLEIQRYDSSYKSLDSLHIILSLDVITSSQILKLPDVDGIIIFTLTGSNIIKVYHIFHEKDTVYQSIELGSIDITANGSTYTIDPSSLIVSDSGVISLYSYEGCLIIYKLKKKVILGNVINKVTEGKWRGDIYDKPEIFTLMGSKVSNRAPLHLKSISYWNCDTNDQLNYSVIYEENDTFHAFYKLTKGGILRQTSHYRLDDQASSTNFIWNHGSLCFTNSCVIARINTKVNLDINTNLASTTELINDSTFKIICPFRKGWGQTTAIHQITASPTNTSIIFFTNKKEAHLFSMEYQIKYRHDEDLPLLQISNIKLTKLETSSLNEIRTISQMNSTEYLTLSKAQGLQIVKIEETNCDLVWCEDKTPPILDLNYSKSLIPRIQISGGSSLESGYLKLMTKGFEYHAIETIVESTKDAALLDFWVTRSYLILSCLESVRIFKLSHIDVIQEVKLPHHISGDLLDVSQANDGDLRLITADGVFSLHETISHSTNLLGKFVEGNDDLIEVSEFNDIRCNGTDICSTVAEISCVFAFHLRNVTYTLFGSWKGDIHLVKTTPAGDSTASKIRGAENVSVKSVLIKAINDEIFFIAADIHGVIQIYNSHEVLVQTFTIGNTPAFLLPYSNNAIIITDYERTVKALLNEQGEMSSKGYVPTKPCSQVKTFNGDLYTFSDGTLRKIKIHDELIPLTQTLSFKEVIRKSITFKNYQNFTLLLSQTMKENNNVQSSLKVISIATGKTINSYNFTPGIEITDCINMDHINNSTFISKESVESGPVAIQLQNIMSQSFVVSCVYHTSELTKLQPSLKAFTIDEHGIITHQCDITKFNTSSESVGVEKSQGKFNKLLNIGEGHIIAVGDVICLFRLRYSIGSSTFSLTRISEFYQTRYFTSVVKKLNDSLMLVGDMIYGIGLLKIVLKEDIESIIKFKFERVAGFEVPGFTALNHIEVASRFIITSDMLDNFRVFVWSEEGVECVSRANLGFQVNTIKSIDHKSLIDLNIESIFNGQDQKSEDIIPLVLIGALNGGVYSLNFITKPDVIGLIQDSLDSVVRNIDEGEEEYEKVKGLKGCHDNNSLNFIDGMLIDQFGEDEEIKRLITRECNVYK